MTSKSTKKTEEWNEIRKLKNEKSKRNEKNFLEGEMKVGKGSILWVWEDQSLSGKRNKQNQANCNQSSWERRETNV